MSSEEVRIGSIIGLEEAGEDGVLVIKEKKSKDIVKVPCNRLGVMIALQQKFGNVITEGWGLVPNGGHVGKVIAWECDDDGELVGFTPVEDWLSGAKRKN